jgi:hypothetical protein
VEDGRERLDVPEAVVEDRNHRLTAFSAPNA